MPPTTPPTMAPRLDDGAPAGEGADWIMVSAETLQGLSLRYCVVAVLPSPVFCSTRIPGGIPPHRSGLPARTQGLRE